MVNGIPAGGPERPQTEVPGGLIEMSLADFFKHFKQVAYEQ